ASYRSTVSGVFAMRESTFKASSKIVIRRVTIATVSGDSTTGRPRSFRGRPHHGRRLRGPAEEGPAVRVDGEITRRGGVAAITEEAGTGSPYGQHHSGGSL